MQASKLAERLGGRLEGADAEIEGVAPLESAGPSHLSFLTSKRYLDRLASTGAGAVLVADDLQAETTAPLIRVTSPYAALRLSLEWLYPQESQEVPGGVHPSAQVDPSARLQEGVSVGPLAVIEAGVSIGARSRVGAGVFLGRETVLGEECRLHAGVVVYRRCRLGDRVEVLANAVIGSDGFGHSREEGTYRKIPQVGIVVLEDDVLVGACTTIDRATFGETRIGRGSRLDNLIMVAHNCVIGPNTAIAAQVGLAGSTIVGGDVQIGGQAGFAGHLVVQDRAIVGARAGVIGDVPEGTFVSGYPARAHREAQAQYAALSQLPALLRRVRDLERRLAQLEEEGE